MEIVQQKKTIPRIYLAAFVPLSLCIGMVLSFLLQIGMQWPMHVFGIFPQRAEGLLGIATMIFVHADWKHLLNNLLSFSMLSLALYYFYSSIANKVLLLSLLLSGAMLWVIGRDSWHIGASGLIYAIAFFLFSSGLLRKHIPLIAVSLIVAFVYGSMVWHIFPWESFNQVSWEGHLSGAISGVLFAFVFRKKGPQKPVLAWEDEEIEYFDNDDESLEDMEANSECLSEDEANVDRVEKPCK